MEETSKKVRQREIKFRCFYIGTMYPVLELHGEESLAVNGIKMNLDELGERVVSPDSEHIEGIMQYTGLKDKNGKEIYEGDIIILPAKQRCLVEWGQNGFICIAIAPIPNGYPKQYESWGPKAYMNEYEVIGNIYEHPHLLSQGEIKTELI